MIKILFTFLFSLLFSSQFSYGTSKAYSLSDYVNDSDFAYLGKIVKVTCLAPNGTVIPIEKPCNGRPGTKRRNRFEFEIEVTKVLSSKEKLNTSFIARFDHNAEYFENQKQPKHKQLGNEYIVFLKRAKNIPGRLLTTRPFNSFFMPDKELDILNLYKTKK